MNDKLFVTAEQVAEELCISKPYAYKIIRKLNKELEEHGYLTIAGRVSRKYFFEKFYGLVDATTTE